jgi:hypothetical protein
MSDGRYDRRLTFEHGLCDDLFIKRPKIFYGAAAATDDYDVYAIFVEPAYALTDTGGGGFSLHNSRVKDDLKIRVSSKRNVHDILYRGAGRGCHNAERADIPRYRLFIELVEHTGFFELSL